MWKRDDAVKPAGTTDGPRTETPRTPGSDTVSSGMSGTPGTIGKSVVIKGELSASEDLTIEGQVEGKVELKNNTLTIGANGKIKASVFAKAVIVQGEVTGNIHASEKIEDVPAQHAVDGIGRLGQPGRQARQEAGAIAAFVERLDVSEQVLDVHLAREALAEKRDVRPDDRPEVKQCRRWLVGHRRQEFRKDF